MGIVLNTYLTAAYWNNENVPKQEKKFKMLLAWVSMINGCVVLLVGRGRSCCCRIFWYTDI